MLLQGVKIVNKKKNYKPKKTAYEIKNDVAYFTKNRLPAFILAGLIIFWTIASIFGLIGYSRTKAKNTALITASADSFQSALRYEYDIDLLPLMGMVSYTSNNADIINGVFTFHIDSEGNYLSYIGENSTSCVEGDEAGISTYGLFGQGLSVTFGYDIIENEFVDDLLYEDISFEIYYEQINSNNVPEFSIRFNFVYNEEVHTVSLVLYLELNYENFYIPYFRKYCRLNQQSIYIGFYSSHVPYSESWYYYSEYIKGIGDYSLGYKEGYNQGLMTPNAELFNEGYEKGKTDGYRNGYDVGFTAGATDGNDYTFTGLLSAIFDVPVKTFTSLFNFDLLGVNLANFFLSMLTLAVVLAVVRMLL